MNNLNLYTNKGLLKSKNDWKEKTNTATLTYDDGSSRRFCFVFQYDGMVEVSEKNTMRLFCMYITEDNGIQKFKERVLHFVILVIPFLLIVISFLGEYRYGNNRYMC